MSKTIKQRTQGLKDREAKLKLQLEGSEDQLKSKAKTVGKIVLVSGLVALAGYFLFQVFFAEDEDEEKPKKKKKNHKSDGITRRISAFAMPYVIEFLDNLLEIKDLKEEKEEEGKGKEESA